VKAKHWVWILTFISIFFLVVSFCLMIELNKVKAYTAALEEQMISYQAENSNLKTGIARLEKEAKTYETNLGRKVAAYEKEIKAYKEQSTDLHARLARAIQDYSDYRNRLYESWNSVAEAINEIRVTLFDNIERESYEALEHELKDFRKALRSY